MGIVLCNGFDLTQGRQLSALLPGLPHSLLSPSLSSITSLLSTFPAHFASPWSMSTGKLVLSLELTVHLSFPGKQEMQCRLLGLIVCN